MPIQKQIKPGETVGLKLTAAQRKLILDGLPCIPDGDLVDQDVDVIVNAWNRNIIPWWLLLPQGVSGAIKRRGGTAPFKELRKHGAIPLGNAVLTSAGRLPFKGIIHVAGINMFWRASERSIRNSVRNALALAQKHGFKSIAFPLIGAGSGGFNQERAKAIMEDELGKVDLPMAVRLVVYEKLGKPRSDPRPTGLPAQGKPDDQPGRRWVVRQVARGLRYRTIEKLIGRTILLRSAGTSLDDIQAVVDELGPGFVFKGPEERNRAGMLAKYGLLDLRYDVPSETAIPETGHDLALLKDLGFLSQSDEGELGLDMFDCIKMLLEDFDKNELVLKLFLEERPKRPCPPQREWEQLMNHPESMPFPKTMEVVDACLTNSEGVWLNKHFYM